MHLRMDEREKVSLFCFSKKAGENREYVKLLILSYFFLWEQISVLEEEGLYISWCDIATGI